MCLLEARLLARSFTGASTFIQAQDRIVPVLAWGAGSVVMDFYMDPDGLHQAVDLMSRDFGQPKALDLPAKLPEVGIGSTVAMHALAPGILGGAARLGESAMFPASLRPGC